MNDPQLSLLVLYTSDIAGCQAFYESLGLVFTAERHGNGPKHVAARLAGGSVLEIYPAGRNGSTGALRLGFVLSTSHFPQARLPLGQHLLRDPDGRAVNVTVSG
ncbi:VOC family protein [Frankia sp. Cas4]|uniref:VOC family protein n=1 Tax=Frankia sp. Cas4 TaxID=3073927 RepID=UPI002AD481E4|nr:VOC family protein [Frankia sp. Cas4]